MVSNHIVLDTLSPPIPSTLYGAPDPWAMTPVRAYSVTSEPTGSPAMMRIRGFFSLRYVPAPLIVPPVPAPATKCVTLPPVCCQISGPVVW